MHFTGMLYYHFLFDRLPPKKMPKQNLYYLSHPSLYSEAAHGQFWHLDPRKRGLQRANSWCDGGVTERDQPPVASGVHN